MGTRERLADAGKLPVQAVLELAVVITRHSQVINRLLDYDLSSVTRRSRGIRPDWSVDSRNLRDRSGHHGSCGDLKKLDAISFDVPGADSGAQTFSAADTLECDGLRRSVGHRHRGSQG